MNLRPADTIFHDFFFSSMNQIHARLLVIRPSFFWNKAIIRLSLKFCPKSTISWSSTHILINRKCYSIRNLVVYGNLCALTVYEKTNIIFFTTTCGEAKASLLQDMKDHFSALKANEEALRSNNRESSPKTMSTKVAQPKPIIGKYRKSFRASISEWPNPGGWF